MKILYFDCFSGISGDMTIGALLDLGVDRDMFLKELSGLALDGYSVDINTKTVNGIRGTDFTVKLDETQDHHSHDKHHHSHDHEHSHDHDHSHDDHEHSHDHDHSHDGHEHGHHSRERGLADIEQIFDSSNLSEKVKVFSKKVFREIAAAEAKVHGKPIDEVHFHEVGAVDSIVDIAGTAICLELLGIDKVYSSALHDGSGFIKCRHGIIPVPVPAVLEMLSGSGIPLISEEVGTELVTPTGMGLIKCLASGFGGKPPMLVERIGYGLGKRDTGRLNALRVLLGETYEESGKSKGEDDNNGGGRDRSKEKVIGAASPELQTGQGERSGRDEIAVLETNIDDTTAEILGYTMEKLLEAGALDAFYTPVFMKKNRPAYMLTVLAAPGAEDRIADIILKETTTLGIRTRYMKRYCMNRETVSIDTIYGAVRVKIAEMGKIKKASPEYEDCRRIAEREGLPLTKVYAMVSAEAAKRHEL